MLKELFAEIGDNTVVGAVSVVTRDLPDNVVEVGNLCRVLRAIGKHDRDYRLLCFENPEAK